MRDTHTQELHWLILQYSDHEWLEWHWWWVLVSSGIQDLDLVSMFNFFSILAATDQFSPNIFQFQKTLELTKLWSTLFLGCGLVLTNGCFDGSECHREVRQQLPSLGGHSDEDFTCLLAQGSRSTILSDNVFFGRYIQKKTKKQPNY